MKIPKEVRKMDKNRAKTMKKKKTRWEKKSQEAVLPPGQVVLPPLARSGRTRPTPAVPAAAPAAVPTGTGDVGWATPTPAVLPPKLPPKPRFGALFRYLQLPPLRYQLVPGAWEAATAARTGGTTG